MSKIKIFLENVLQCIMSGLYLRWHYGNTCQEIKTRRYWFDIQWHKLHIKYIININILYYIY
jgi:hypothetical protein